MTLDAISDEAWEKKKQYIRVNRRPIMYITAKQKPGNEELCRAIQTCQVQNTMGEYYLLEVQTEMPGSENVLARMKAICALISCRHGGKPPRAIEIGNKQFYSNSERIIGNLESEADKEEARSNIE